MDKRAVLNDLWTMRWTARNKPQTPAGDLLKEIDRVIAEVEGAPLVAVKPAEVVTPAPAPGAWIDPAWKKGAGLKLIPFAEQSKRRLNTKGRYAKGYPSGALVHFTAGRFESGRQNAINELNSTPYTFLCIATDGTLVQGHDVDRWGNHAGESKWTNVAQALRLVGSVSDDLIGIEINNAGMVTKQKDGRFKTWYGAFLEASQVRYVTEEEYGCPTGYYHKYTPKQEETLIKTLLWLYVNDPVGCFSFDHVLGHHEVAGKKGIGYWRKNDPGGALSMTMDQLRALLKSLV